MSHIPPRPPDDFDNPYAAPEADLEIVGQALDDEPGDAEEIRRQYLNHEASVRSVGSLYLLGAILGGLGAVYFFAVGLGLLGPPANPNNPAIEPTQLIMLGVGAIYAFLTILNGSIGWGLRNLRTWARWTVVVLMTLGLFYVFAVAALQAFLISNPGAAAFTLLIAGGIPAYIIYLMASSKGSMVFSHEYKLIIAKTPHIKYKTSLLLKVLVALVLALVVLAIIGALLSSRR